MRSGFRFWGCLGFGGLGCICRLGFGYVGLRVWGCSGFGGLGCVCGLGFGDVRLEGVRL